MTARLARLAGSRAPALRVRQNCCPCARGITCASISPMGRPCFPLPRAWRQSGNERQGPGFAHHEQRLGNPYGVVVLVDTHAAAGVTVTQLADYIAMISFAKPDLEADLGRTESILQLFAVEPANRPRRPHGMGPGLPARPVSHQLHAQATADGHCHQDGRGARAPLILLAQIRSGFGYHAHPRDRPPSAGIRFLGRDVAQPGSALAWGARGPEFKSRHPDQSSRTTLARLFVPHARARTPAGIRNRLRMARGTLACGKRSDGNRGSARLARQRSGARSRRFVGDITRMDGVLVGRWEQVVCPLMVGVSEPQANFVRQRIDRS